MTDYLANPVPYLSANNVELICRKMDEGFEFFAEYGMGASTLYFIRRFRAHRATIISVENTIGWFETVIERIRSEIKVDDVSKTVSPVSLARLYALASELRAVNPRVPERLSRRKRWREVLLLGPFYRFAPGSPSRLAGKLPLWPVVRWIFVAAAYVVYALFPRKRPCYGEFRGQAGPLSLIFRNVPPAIKDQFGESPTAGDYIEAGLSDVKDALRKRPNEAVKALFVIDGGPRGEIVRSILELERSHDNFLPTVFLCDAHQAFYGDVLASRPNGRFLPGSNLTLAGNIVQETPRQKDEETMLYMFGRKSVTREELAQKEVWFYERAEKRVTA